MKKIICVAFSAILFVVLFAACGKEQGSAKTPEQTRALEIIEYVYAGEFEKITQALPVELQAQVTASVWEEAFKPYLGEGGAFGDFVEYLGVSQTSKTMDGVGDIAVVFQEAKHANGKIIWHVELNGEGELVNLFVKPV